MLNVKFVDKLSEANSCICVFVSEKLELSKFGKQLDDKLNGAISKLIKARDDFTGKHGQLKSVTSVSENVLYQIFIIGTGSDKELTEHKIQELGGSVATALKASRSKSGLVESIKMGKFDSNEVASFLAFGSVLSTYSFDKYLTGRKPTEIPVLESIEFYSEDKKESEDHFKEYDALAHGIYEARDVACEPANVLYPDSYSKIIEEKLSPLGVEVEILGEREMKNLGMNALLGVGQGSARESKLVVMKYNGKNDNSAPIAFIGKGVTFDTGGISIKPSRNMGDMKYDMCGSAAVYGTILALAKRGAKVNAVGVVGLVENMPGGNAQRPGDIVKTMSGQTVEVLDTDAEGRLVLSDALWYTQEKFKPTLMIDLATLTGAVSIALGNTYAGLFSNNEDLAENLLKSGKNSGEELWRLPLHANFDKMIKSSVADVANLGSPPGHASSSTAAQFLQKFVNNVPWAHLDIANVAYDSKPKALAPAGAFGYGIRLLNKLVKDNYE